MPVLVTRPAPLQDWPNHIARIHVLIGLLHGDPFWSHYYRFTGFMVPNAALDLGILALTHLGLAVEPAAQLFLLCGAAVFACGFCMLARALGVLDPTKPVFAILLFYCSALFWGLVNYMLGAGLMLGLLGLWIVAEKRPWSRFALALGGGVLMLFTHVVACVAWIVALGCFELCRFVLGKAALQRRILDLAPYGLVVVLVGGLLRAMQGDAGHDFHVVYAGSGVGAILMRKLLLFARLLLGGDIVQDAASVAAALACCAAVGLARPRLAAAPALAVMVLLVVAIAAPERIGDGSQLDTRLVLLPVLMFAACVRLEPRSWAFPVAASAVLARTLVLAWSWHVDGRAFDDFRRQIASLPPGGVMMAAYGTNLRSLSRQQIWSPPITAIATGAAARGLFVPAIFADPSQQPIALRQPYGSLAQPWNLTDAAHLRMNAAVLGSLCRQRLFAGVYLTVLYPGTFLPSALGLPAGRRFLLLDACALRDSSK